MHDRRHRLRAVTRPGHEQVERSIERAGLFDSLEGYGQFLAAMHRFHSCAEAALQAAAEGGHAPGWRRPASARLLRGDLAALDLAPAPARPVPLLADRGAVLGLCYVTLGSALGATQLLPRARALGASPGRGGAFLAHHAGCTREWLEFLSTLEAAELAAHELESLEDTACRGFGLVGECLRSSCCAKEV